MALGAALGVIAGVLAGHVAIWLGIGIAIGMVLGASVRGRGTSLCPRCADLHRSQQQVNEISTKQLQS
jgi:hypothetical protein